ncbi:MAG: hypothetical protein VCA18_06285 [Opitutales bacterium]
MEHRVSRFQVAHNRALGERIAKVLELRTRLLAQGANPILAPPPTPVREALGNQSWKSNFLAIEIRPHVLNDLSNPLASHTPGHSPLGIPIE